MSEAYKKKEDTNYSEHFGRISVCYGRVYDDSVQALVMIWLNSMMKITRSVWMNR